MVSPNVRRGLFRLWVVASLLYITGQLVNFAFVVSDPSFQRAEFVQVATIEVMAALGPPFLLFVVVGAFIWVTGGFRRRPGDGGAADKPVRPIDRAPGWSNPETYALYRHLDSSWHDTITAIAEKTAQKSAPAGIVVWDRSRSAHRQFARALRTSIEDVFDAFYLDGVGDERTRALVRDVGSLWRANWDELAERLLADIGNIEASPLADAPDRTRGRSTNLSINAAKQAADAAAGG